MAGLADILGGLGGIGEGYLRGTNQLQQIQSQQYTQALRALAMQQQMKAQQSAPAAFQTLIGGGLDNLMGGGGGQVPSMAPGQIEQEPLPPVPQAAQQMAAGPGDVRGSWFGSSPGWSDPSDSGLQAGGQPVSAGPGIALPDRATLGQQFAVTAPNGQTLTLPQTDIGPAKWTGRGVDINSPAAAAFGYTPKDFPTDQTFHVALADFKASIPPEARKEGLSGARNVLQGSGNPLTLVGKYDPVTLARAIKQANPDASDEVNMATFDHLFPLLSNAGKLDFTQMLQLMNYQQRGEHYEGMEDRPNYMPITGPDGVVQAFDTHSGRTINTPLAPGSSKLGGAGGAGGTLAVSKQLEITPKDGQPYTVVAREGRNKAGWVDSFSGEPLKIPEGAKVKEVTAGTAGGGRAGAQLQRQITAAPEIKSDLLNVAKLPVGSTMGPFGSMTPGTTLSGALKTDLATGLTTDDERLMQMGMAGFQRELSTIQSPVYVGKYASEQLNSLMPRAGDNVGTTLYGFARIKQTATNALESLLPNPLLSTEQKDYIQQHIKAINEAIPWTTDDVMAFRQQQDPKESFGEYVQRTGVSGAAKKTGGLPASTDIMGMDRAQIIPLLDPKVFSTLTPEQQVDIDKRVDQLSSAPQ
jgi:hypothetical protein